MARTVDKDDIAALLESLCERPLAGDEAEMSVELEAFCRQAGDALARQGTGEAQAQLDQTAEAGIQRFERLALPQRTPIAQRRPVQPTAPATCPTATNRSPAFRRAVEAIRRSLGRRSMIACVIGVRSRITQTTSKD